MQITKAGTLATVKIYVRTPSMQRNTALTPSPFYSYQRERGKHSLFSGQHPRLTERLVCVHLKCGCGGGRSLAFGLNKDTMVQRRPEQSNQSGRIQASGICEKRGLPCIGRVGCQLCRHQSPLPDVSSSAQASLSPGRGSHTRVYALGRFLQHDKVQ